MPLHQLISRLRLGLIGFLLSAALIVWVQEASSVSRVADLKGHMIVEAGTLVARTTKDYPPSDPQGRMLQWYELVLTAGQPRICLTFTAPQFGLTEPRTALLLLDAQQSLKVAVLRDTVGGMMAEVAPIQMVQCPR